MSAPSCRRASFSLDEKRRVLEHLRISGRVRDTIERFYPQLASERYDARRRLVLSWRRNAREILQGAATRQGAARKRMRRPKTQKPKPPRPRGLESELELQDEPISAENEHEVDEFQPIVLTRSRPRTKETQIRQVGVPDETQIRAQIQDEVQIQDEAPVQDQTEDGIQDLIASAVEQSVTKQSQLRAEEEAEIASGSGSGSGPGSDQDLEVGKSDSDLSSQDAIPAETKPAKVIKRSSFSLDEKRRVLEHLATAKNVRETIDTFYPDLPPEEFKTRRRTIWRWRKSTEQIVAGCADDKASARKKMRPQGIVCHRGPKHVEPQDVVDRLLTTAKKSELKRKSRVLRPAPPTPGLLVERQIDSLVFSALGLPPTTQFPLILPAPTSPSAVPAEAAAPTMRSLKRGEATFAIRRR
ncbi:hypothetical protein KRP22_007983 [Phytophthora ramorum]|nr:hypothetical protein KRP22_4006 [Phytophthora ramorum]